LVNALLADGVIDSLLYPNGMEGNIGQSRVFGDHGSSNCVVLVNSSLCKSIVKGEYGAFVICSCLVLLLVPYLKMRRNMGLMPPFWPIVV
jgi:xanthine/uracil permease